MVETLNFATLALMISVGHRTELFDTLQEGTELVARSLDRLTNACRVLWRELFTRASFLIGFLTGRGHKQGD